MNIFTKYRLQAVFAVSLLQLAACSDSSSGGSRASTLPPANRAPVADAGADITALEGSLVQLDGSASSDPDGDSLQFEWSQVAGPDAVLANANSASASLTLPNVSEDAALTFELKVSDGNVSRASRVKVFAESLEASAQVTGTKALQVSWEAVEGVDHFQLLRNADGASGFSVMEDAIAADATSLDIEVPVHLLDWTNAAYILQACIDAACISHADSNEISLADLVANEAIGFLKASNAEFGDQLRAVAISADGQTIAMGARFEDSDGLNANSGREADNGLLNSGAVYIFHKETDGWVQEAYLKPFFTRVGSEFGSALDISADGSTVVVGAPKQNFGPGNNPGAAYIYRLAVDADGARSWSGDVTELLLASNLNHDDEFGASVAISGDGRFIVVGAPKEDSVRDGGGNVDPASNAGTNTGAVYAYTFEAGRWNEADFLKVLSISDNDRFGEVVDISFDGSVIAVGMPAEDSDDGSNNDNLPGSGAVAIFEQNGLGWQHELNIKASGMSANDRFGESVSLSGSGKLLAVGASGEDSSSNGINSTVNDDGSNTGAAYLYKRDDVLGNWNRVPIAYLKASTTADLDRFGVGVALSSDGTVLAVGSMGESSSSEGIDESENDAAPSAGAVYVFSVETDGLATTVEQVRRVKASNPSEDDRLSNGAGLALNDDGSVLVATSAHEDSNSDGAEDPAAAESGAAYVY